MASTKIIEPAPSAYDYQLLIGRILEQPLKYNPDAEIVYRDVSCYTYRNLFNRVSRQANLLTAELDVQPGETVGILDYDSHRFLEGYFSIPMIGAVLHTINFRHSEQEIVYAINHAEDKVIFCNEDFIPLLEKLKSQLPAVRKLVVLKDSDKELVTSLKIEGEYEEMLSRQKGDYAFPDFEENSVATIFFTTGTTGLPKAVYFSHRQLVLQTMGLSTTLGALNSVTKISPNDVYMPITPLFHVHAWGMPYVATYLGMKQVYPGKYEPAMLLQLKRDEGVTLSHGVPTLLEMICDHPDVARTHLSDWKMVCGGSILPKGLATKALSLGMNVIVGYGMSETGPAISLAYIETQMINGSGDDEGIDLRLKAGRPVHLSDVRLRNDAGEFVAHDGVSPGEIVVRSPWSIAGYYNDAERSEELWKDGYLHTGDIGVIDRNGVITVVDRKKDLVKSGGEWISSSLLESLISFYDGIAEVAVVAVPDDKWTEHPLAVIVPYKDKRIDEANVIKHLQQFVSSGTIKPFAIPKEYRFVDALPKTSTGKIDKKEIKVMLGFT